MPITPQFSDRLRALRQDAGVTPYRLAKDAGLSAQAVYDLESGARPDPRWSTVCALALALGVSTEDFRPAEK